jgi:hypothetical protein
MIIICEPQCKGFSHEKVNSGFIYALRLAFPEEKLVFYADGTHIDSIQNILSNDKIIISNIEYRPIKFGTSFSWLGMLSYSILFRKMFKEAIHNETDKIFFLSFTAPILYVIKKIKREIEFKQMKFSFVLHGDFENIADPSDIKPQMQVQLQKKSVSRRIKSIKLKEIPFKLLARVKYLPQKRILKRRSAFSKKYAIKDIMLFEHSPDFRYLALSPYILTNAAKYINVVELNLHAINFPTVFAPISDQPENEYVKFAVFGYGNSAMLQRVLSCLANKKVEKNYEIRIIGMDNRGTEGFEKVTCPSPGKPLTRFEMEEYAEDIDIFLILYDEYRYRLSCSGSIIESLSYMKPIIHFENDCINYFNKTESSMGISCNSVEEYARIMEDIINNYQEYRIRFNEFRTNILQKRNMMSIENSAHHIRDYFTWQ